MGRSRGVYYQKEHQRITNNTDSGQWLIVTDATGDRWVKCEELRFRGDAGCLIWRKATVDEIIEHFKNR